MDLKQANEVAALELEKSKIVAVLSNKSVWNLDNESEIEAVKEYAANNKLEMFIVKGGEVVSEEAEKEAPEDKPKKKK